MGAAWYLPSWVEDTDLTIQSKPAFLLWLLYRGAGCNITPVAKRIVYFKNRDPTNVYHQSANRPVPAAAHQRHPLKISNERHYKFHSLAIDDGFREWAAQNRDIAATYAAARQKPLVANLSKYKEICYTHVVPRSTPPHSLPFTAEHHKMTQGCPGLELPVETVSPPSMVSMATHDGRQLPLLETQIYSVYPAGNSRTAFKRAGDADPSPSRATQTGVGNQAVLVNIDESLPMIETSEDHRVADECISHYWNGPDYPELPSVPDFKSTPTNRRPQAVYVFNQRHDNTAGFRNAVDTSSDVRDRAGYEDEEQDPFWQPGLIRRYASYLQLPMIYFYHY